MNKAVWLILATVVTSVAMNDQIRMPEDGAKPVAAEKVKEHKKRPAKKYVKKDRKKKVKKAPKVKKERKKRVKKERKGHKHEVAKPMMPTPEEA